ncbi:MAG: thiamine pyrophosphate-dependent dehydrogenase E1 component subunit alpha, partial [SAR324 cluster bacterium]|nr:thiamine pyrophosphate-dependent dehydrogenase E1 component subunit alpha [SAR324 cluster bacterium]
MTDQQEKQQALRFFRQLVRVRIFEERVSELFVQGGTAGSMLHLSIGEEAGAVGVMGAMREGDGFTTHHRGHGIFLARGADPKKMMAEIAGKSTGYCRGKGGSMHIADRGLGHLGANAIVGGGISHVVGAGLTYQMKHHGNAAVAFFGDGAMQQGVLYESMNLSALWKLPVLFVCVNNEYGMGTRLDQASATLEFEKRAETFGLLAAEVDGIDVFEVYNQSKNLLEDVRKGKPAFLKVNSYRFHGHARMDKSPYRDQQEEEEGRKKDAIAFL